MPCPRYARQAPVQGGSADAVAPAFDQTLRARLQPLGLVSVTQARSP